jgi:uncharacterized protein DUF1998
MSPLEVGELRKSQAVQTFGIGATIDLPHFTVVGLGTEFWNRPNWDPTQAINAVDDERLLGLVRSFLGPSVKQLTLPPTNPETSDPQGLYGMPVSTFPTWGRCPRCELMAPYDHGHFKLEHPPNRPDAVKYVHRSCLKAGGRNVDVNPVRFVVACTNGHLADFPWEKYIRGKGCKCTPCGPLRLQERGVSAEVAELWLNCDTCGTRRIMTEAFERDEVTGAYPALGECTGHHPHLGRDHTSTCEDAILRPMLLGASNQWFPLLVSALTIPGNLGRLSDLVAAHWSALKDVPNEEVLQFLLSQGLVPNELSEFELTKVFVAIEAKRSEAPETSTTARAADLKIDEWPLLSQPNTAPRTEDFELRPVSVPTGYERLIESVVQVPRLRVVKAMTGFTRIDSPGDYSDIADIEEAKRVSIADGVPEWVPAFEVRGEGIFIRLREDAIATWRKDPSVERREARLLGAHAEFRRVRGIDPADDGADVLRFTLLHSLSHALIRQFAIECGYASASIQERIYSMAADDPSGLGPMAGILLMTAAADSEGTLGGLVALGETRTIGRHLRAALDRAGLCSSDPLCGEHAIAADGRTLHGAACHACMFVSETSCERANRLVDRALLVGTNGADVQPFFGGVES